ncbi:axonemal dynein light chain domain-containing protein 1 [Cariama cristata]
MLGHTRPVSSSLERSFVPKEVIRSLNCASSSLYSPEHLWSLQTTKAPMGFRHATLADNLVPKEFNIVKNGGVLPLKYFEKPSGRLDVIQLMELMDSMLEKANQNYKLIRITRPSQLHNVLELMKAEQNIYNIIFHELIRQLSMDCVERGQLLSKLRQRYVGLLERIPEQMKTLYKKMMTQRLVDKHITEEAVYGLYEVLEDDLKVTKEAEKAQEELAAAMQEAKANANLLEEYRELYELQRRRLEEQVLLLAQERIIWSSAAYDLALKIIDRNQLTLVRGLHVSGKTLTNVLKHFIVLLASKDTGDLADLQEETEQFRERLGCVGAEMEHSEESSRGKLQIVCSSINKWLQHFHGSTARFLTALVRSMEGWLFKMQKLKRGSGMHEAELQAFYHSVPAWLAQVDAMMSCIGSSQLHEVESNKKLLLRDCQCNCSKGTVRGSLEADLEADFELEELNKIKCCNWIQACSLLLSEIKGTPVSFLNLEELRNLFGSEQQPGAGMDYLTEENEATADMIRYVGCDSNIHLQTLKSDILSVTGVGVSTAPETEICAQNAEEKSEGLEEKLEEALQRIKELESELEKEGKVIPEGQVPHWPQQAKMPSEVATWDFCLCRVPNLGQSV